MSIKKMSMHLAPLPFSIRICVVPPTTARMDFGNRIKMTLAKKIKNLIDLESIKGVVPKRDWN
jgi:hypothetical protein